MLEQHQRFIGRLAWVMSLVAIVFGQLRTLAWYRDDRHLDRYPVVTYWIDLWDRAFHPLLAWASPETVYLTYGKIWAPTFLLLCGVALLGYRRHERSGLDLLTWRATLVTMASFVVTSFAEFYLQLLTRLPEPWTTVLARANMWSLMLTLLASTLLGLRWLRGNHKPRIAGWLLALSVPSFAVWLATGIGSPAMAPMLAFGLLGRRIAMVPSLAPITVRRQPQPLAR